MSSIRNIVQLVEAHLAGDHDLFVSTVLAIADASEATGKKMMALDLRRLVQGGSSDEDEPIVAKPLPDAVGGMVDTIAPRMALDDIVLDDDLGRDLRRIVREVENAPRLAGLGLAPRRRVLLSGPTGTGKTSSAGALAKALRLPLYVVRLDGIVKSHLGETAGNLRRIFDCVDTHPGVWFFDEVDALAADRSVGHDTGEIRRTVNSLLGMIENAKVQGLLMAATNLPDIVDKAVLRRFDVHLRFSPATRDDLPRIVQGALRGIDLTAIDWHEVAGVVETVGHADIVVSGRNAAVDAVLDGRQLRTEDLVREIRRRVAS